MLSNPLFLQVENQASQKANGGRLYKVANKNSESNFLSGFLGAEDKALFFVFAGFLPRGKRVVSLAWI